MAKKTFRVLVEDGNGSVSAIFVAIKATDARAAAKLVRERIALRVTPSDEEPIFTGNILPKRGRTRLKG